MGTSPIDRETTEAGYRTCGADNGDNKENQDPNQNKIMPLRKTKTVSMSMLNTTADAMLGYVTTNHVDVRSVMRAGAVHPRSGPMVSRWCRRSPAMRHAIAIAQAVVVMLRIECGLQAA